MKVLACPSAFRIYFEAIKYLLYYCVAILLLISCSVFVCTGTMTAFTESAWSPSRGLNNGKDMQWGGGSLFAFEDEKKDAETGTCRIWDHINYIITLTCFLFN